MNLIRISSDRYINGDLVQSASNMGGGALQLRMADGEEIFVAEDQAMRVLKAIEGCPPCVKCGEEPRLENRDVCSGCCDE